ncbi:MAG: DUF192 domain-containing protein [Thaumarchaeota archaeon]|nr:DUF192 domain-containing protein [Nitrososphaerota archaeon]MDE1877152.1 DUF192 domain-containing protein [Nitrososphaerota archaeon]
MKKTVLPVVMSFLLIISTIPSFAQTNSTVQDFKTLQQQRNQDSSNLSYAVFYITENDKCSDSEYKSLKFYQVVTDEYLSLYGISHDLQGSLCIPLKNYQSYFSGLSTFTLPVVISDNTVGQQLVQQGFYGMYKITGTGMQAIYVCSCDTKIESWAGAWILSHELSHFSLRYIGEPDTIAVSWVHYIQALENDCQRGNFAKVCPQYSASVTSPSGNQIPVMVVYGQGPSTNLPQNAPQSEVVTLPENSIVQTQNPACQTNQICALPGDYLKYQITTPDLNQTIRFDFENPTDNKNITIKTSAVQNGLPVSEYDTLDLSKALFTRPSGNASNFMYMLPTPLRLNSAYHQQAVQFNNYTRDVMSAQNNNQTNSILVQIDKDTGILIQLAISHVVNVNGEVSVSQQSYKLIDTNKIAYSNYATGQVFIPSWIKIDAKFWSDGSITDAQFIQEMQYLIDNRMITIPQTIHADNPSSQIPSWIKDDAKYWSSGSVSDNEFAGAIQYLVSNDVISISSSQNDTSPNLTGLPKGQVKIGNVLLDVEIADTLQRQNKGLQYHTPLSYSQGMLFPFAQPQVISIWMKDMQFPIDIIWLDSSGNVLYIEKNAPPCISDPCTIYGQSLMHAQYVLEVASGFVDKFGITQNSHMQLLTPV